MNQLAIFLLILMDFEGFSFENWMDIFKEANVDYKLYLRERDLSEILPWDHLSSGIKKEFLKKELFKAKQGKVTEDCRFAMCSDCGVCPTFKTYNLLAKKG